MSYKPVASRGPMRLCPAAFAVFMFTFVTGVARAEPAAFGEVTYVARDRAYLRSGRLDGLREGESVSVERDGIEVGRVTVLNTGDHNASVQMSGGGTIRIGDRVVFAAPKPRPTAVIVSKKPRDISQADLAALWVSANEAYPPRRVRYEGGDEDRAVASFSGRAETDYHLYTYFNRSSLTRHEQHFSFSARGENLGTEGLDVRLRGQVLARYDDRPDLYLDGRRGIPLIRELAVRYHPEKRAFFGAFGRFSPQMPQASVIDGIEAGFDTRSVTGSFFGGLKPEGRDLVPTVHRQTFGALVGFRPKFRSGTFETDEGVSAEMKDGRFTRTTVTIDNRFSAGAKMFASQIAAFDFLGADANGNTVSDFAVSLLGLDVAYRFSKRTGMDFRARYDEQTVFEEDAESLSAQWIDALRGRKHGRAELGVSTRSKKGNAWRPFVFGLGDFSNGIDTAYTGVGFQWSDDALFSTRTRMITSFDFGFGTGQAANLNLSFDTPFLRNRLNLRSGLYNTYRRAQDTSVNTMSHLLFLVLSGQITRGLELFADLSAAYDHALVRLTYPFGGRMQFQVGASYDW